MKATFAYVETTDEGARAQLMECMSQLAFVAADGRAEKYDADLDLLERQRYSAVYVHFGDDLSNDAILLNMLVASQPIVVGPLNNENESKAPPLIERCAAVLGYEVVEV